MTEQQRPTPGPFKLYPEERHWWSFNDYAAVVGAVYMLKTRKGQRQGIEEDAHVGDGVHVPQIPGVEFRVLEFGPGSSTLSLIEGGATRIDTCEDNPDWAKTYEERLVQKFPAIVRLIRYRWSDPLAIPALEGERYDMALIDGPLGSDRRGDVVRYAIHRCDAVLVPTEDRNPKVRQALQAIAQEHGLKLEIRETGPLSGGFALLTRPPRPPIAADAPDADAPDAPQPAPAAGEHAEAPGAASSAPAPAASFDVDEPRDTEAPESSAPSARRKRGKRSS